MAAESFNGKAHTTARHLESSASGVFRRAPARLLACFSLGAAALCFLFGLHGRVGAVQLLGGDFPAVTKQHGQVVDAAVDGLFDELLVGGAGAAEHEVDDGLADVECARVADAQSEAPVARGAEVGGEVTQAVVGAGAAELEAGGAGHEVQFVVRDEDVPGVDAVEARQGADGLSGAVHVSHGLDEPHDLGADADFADIPEEFGVGAHLAGVVAQQGVDEPEAGVVPVAGVLVGGVAQADDQAGGVHERNVPGQAQNQTGRLAARW